MVQDSTGKWQICQVNQEWQSSVLPLKAIKHSHGFVPVKHTLRMSNTDYHSLLLKSKSSNSCLEKWSVLAYSLKNFYLQNFLYTLFPRVGYSKQCPHGSKVLITRSYLNLTQIQNHQQKRIKTSSFYTTQTRQMCHISAQFYPLLSI